MSKENSDPFNAFVSQNTISPYYKGELDGLTFAIKDNIDVANEITGYGSPWWAQLHAKPISNAVCLDQLLFAGATCVGKTLTDELARSLIGINPFYNIPLNPKAPDRVTGGSSSGSASAVASSLVDFAIGTDTAGSVRVPASNCGIWGYRPSHGLISLAGVAALAPSFDTVGVFTNSGDILKRVMKVLLAEENVECSLVPSICFLEDMFQICENQIQEAMIPIVGGISNLFPVKHLKLSSIANVDCGFLYEQARILLAKEIWNTFGALVESSDQQNLSLKALSSFRNLAELANQKNIQNSIWNMKFFSKKINEFLNKGNLLCFPTTPDLAPKKAQISEEFLSVTNYYRRAIGIMAISGLSRTPQITIPLVQVGEVPIGLSFIAGYGQDMALINFCNNLNLQYFAKEAIKN